MSLDDFDPLADFAITFPKPAASSPSFPFSSSPFDSEASSSLSVAPSSASSMKVSSSGGASLIRSSPVSPTSASSVSTKSTPDTSGAAFVIDPSQPRSRMVRAASSGDGQHNDDDKKKKKKNKAKLTHATLPRALDVVHEDAALTSTTSLDKKKKKTKKAAVKKPRSKSIDHDESSSSSSSDSSDDSDDHHHHDNDKARGPTSPHSARNSSAAVSSFSSSSSSSSSSFTQTSGYESRGRMESVDDEEFRSKWVSPFKSKSSKMENRVSGGSGEGMGMGVSSGDADEVFRVVKQRTATSLGFAKQVVTWHFSYNGGEHEVVLFHSILSGKRTICVDGTEQLVEKKLFDVGKSEHVVTVHAQPGHVKPRFASFPATVIIEAAGANFAYDLRIDGLQWEHVKDRYRMKCEQEREEAAAEAAAAAARLPRKDSKESKSKK